MDWLVFIGSPRRRDLVSWSPEARELFRQIAEELSGTPGVRVATQLRRPVIVAGRRIAVAGHKDGIAVRLDGDRMRSALQIPGCRLLGKGDGRVVRGMVAVPWSAREHWRELARAATAPA
jgi:hypothetical protein